MIGRKKPKTPHQAEGLGSFPATVVVFNETPATGTPHLGQTTALESIFAPQC